MFTSLDAYVGISDFFYIVSILFLTSFIVFLVTSIKFRYPLLLDFTTNCSILILIYLFFLVINNPWSEVITFNNMFMLDNHSLFLKLLLIISSICVLSMSKDYFKYSKINKFEYPILILLSLEGMFLLVTSYDLFTMYLALELQSLCFYILATFKRYSESSTEAGLKYFVLGSIASGILLYGISLVYGITGSTNFEDIFKLLSCSNITLQEASSSYSILENSFPFSNFISKFMQIDFAFKSLSVGLIFILVAFLFKLAVAPFHMWSPDVYEGSPTSTTLVFSILSKIAISGTMVRLYSYLFSNFYFLLDDLFIWSCCLSILIGSISALYQQNIKRFIAFTSISHVGFLLLALIGNTEESLYSFYFYLIIYCFMFFSFFSIIYSMNKKTGNYATLLKDFNHLSIINKPLAIAFSIILFSLAGVPPMAGFFSKYFILLGGAKISYYLVIFIGLSIGSISSFYYVRIIKDMFFNTLESKFVFPIYYKTSYVNAFIISSTCIFLTIGIFFLYYLNLINFII